MNKRTWQLIWFVLMVFLLFLVANARGQEFTLLRLIAKQEVNMKTDIDLLRIREAEMRHAKVRELLAKIHEQVSWLTKLDSPKVVSLRERKLVKELKENVEKLEKLIGH